MKFISYMDDIISDINYFPSVLLTLHKKSFFISLNLYCNYCTPMYTRNPNLLLFLASQTRSCTFYCVLRGREIELGGWFFCWW